ncbi:unnamed protein product [Clonostachys rosea]|uniref:FAD-binding domain-containing protein n=1 Tax=Bionectria ochroleuca TaxID=29856 RepID=A0ABY6UN71_BIOOC|nr:unnamed protein product [Clonostachys rosea]
MYFGLMKQRYLAGKTIIVAGAGISGLSFALSLKKLWPTALEPPNVIVYERETNIAPNGREGYSLSIAGFGETGGLFAARDLGILDEIIKHATPGLGDEFTFNVWDNSWGEILKLKFKPAPGLSTAGIRIPRKVLRKVLVDALGQDHIRWGIGCVGAEKTEDGRMLVKLSGGNLPVGQSVAECDLLVVADGASSKIRSSLRPDDGLSYAGIMQKGGLAIFPNGIPKPVDKNWGMVISSGKGVALFVSPYDETSVAWGISYRSSTIEPPLDSIEDAQSMLDECRELGKEFSDPFQAIINATNPKDVSRLAARDKKPFNHDLTAGQVIFIGDSNHAVSPFSGYGASLALKDGWDLSSQLCHATSLSDAVKAYDAISVPRATKVLKESHSRINMGHATGMNYLFARAFLSIGGFILGIKDAISHA